MSNKQKAQILTKFFFRWVMPRVAVVLVAAFVLWVGYSTLEIAVADPSQIGRDYWDFNFWTMAMEWSQNR